MPWQLCKIPSQIWVSLFCSCFTFTLLLFKRQSTRTINTSRSFRYSLITWLALSLIPIFCFLVKRLENESSNRQRSSNNNHHEMEETISRRKSSRKEQSMQSSHSSASGHRKESRDRDMHSNLNNVLPSSVKSLSSSTWSINRILIPFSLITYYIPFSRSFHLRKSLDFI